jgi:hypothetical protein
VLAVTLGNFVTPSAYHPVCENVCVVVASVDLVTVLPPTPTAVTDRAVVVGIVAPLVDTVVPAIAVEDATASEEASDAVVVVVDVSRVAENVEDEAAKV